MTETTPSVASRRLMPAEVKRRVSFELDRVVPLSSQGYVSVTPQDQAGRRCAAWCAHRYEVFAYPIATGAQLEPIADALRGLPGATDVTVRTAGDFARDVASSRAAPVRPGVYAHLPVREVSAS